MDEYAIPLPHVEGTRTQHIINNYTPDPYKKKYPQNWSAYNQAQTQEKFMFLKIVSEAVNTLNIKTYGKTNGRPPIQLSDMIKCCIIKVYTGQSSRRNTPDLEITRLLRYIERKPHFNTVIKYMNDPQITKLLEQLILLTSSPLAPFETSFAADATGISTYNKDAWIKVKLDFQKHREYRKLHIMCGTHTNVITGIQVTTSRAADSPRFKELLNQTAKNFDIREVSADAAYISKENVQAVEDVGAKPYIMPKRNIKIKNSGCPAWGRMLRLFRDNQARFRAHYHKRSNVEASFAMIKRKFCNFIRSKADTSQTNEILCKAICHNISCLIHAVYELDLSLTLLQ